MKTQIENKSEENKKIRDEFMKVTENERQPTSEM
jgi:hypothetical protein